MAVLFKGDGCSQDELARRAFKDKATVARALRILEDEGFITRVEAAHNRRMKLVHLTEKARSLAMKTRRVVAEVDAALTQGLNPEQIGLLKGLLAGVEANARRLHQNQERR